MVKYITMKLKMVFAKKLFGRKEELSLYLGS